MGGLGRVLLLGTKVRVLVWSGGSPSPLSTPHTCQSPELWGQVPMQGVFLHHADH